ncbi:hypothetical protein GCM10023163_12840 [Aestuariibaculum suncheonense]
MRFCIPFYLFLLLTGFEVTAQGSPVVFGETILSIDHSLSEFYKMSFTTRSRFILLHNQIAQYNQQQVDIFHFSTFNLSKDHDVSLGLYYRNRDIFETGSDELRFTEQYNYKTHKKGINFGHRFRSEQRLLDFATIFRQRYRLSATIPLNDKKPDTENTYFEGCLEGLVSFSKVLSPEIDQRYTAQIGWHLTKNLKLETGLEYRLEAFNLTSRHNIFVLTQATMKL